MLSKTAALPKQLSHSSVEQWTQQFWASRPVKAQYEAAMILPPPNVTGNLHLGHALTAAIQDTYIRQRRMNGHNILWIPGFDHAGLGTQHIVDKVLWDRQRLHRNEIGKEKYLELINEWRHTRKQDMSEQLRSMGLCLDYEKEFFTLDDDRSLAVKESFKLLFNRGLITRREKMVHWSETSNSTLSDIEVEKDDTFNDTTPVYKCFRTGEVIKQVSMKQWFLDTNEAAERAVELVNDDIIKIIPPSYKKSWSAWLVDSGPQDWCLSRQSWWGHSIPAYRYSNSSDCQENWVVANDENEAADLLEEKFTEASSDIVKKDTDVLDTWFSSALLPFSVNGWPNEDKFNCCKKSNLFPLELMETGFDILNFWVSKMVMMSLLLTGEIPFKNIVLHGMICDSNGKKMSKSKGNVIDPLHIMKGLDRNEMTQEIRKMFPNGIKVTGADGMRAYLMSNDLHDHVTRIQSNRLEHFRKLTNKIWNVYQFVLFHVGNEQMVEFISMDGAEYLKLTCELDKKLVENLIDCISLNLIAFNDHIYNIGINRLSRFWFDDLSRDYMQSINTLFKTDSSNKTAKLQLLSRVIIEATKLTHPYMPHITEYLYQHLFLSTGKKSYNVLERIGDCRYPTVRCWQELVQSTELFSARNNN